MNGLLRRQILYPKIMLKTNQVKTQTRYKKFPFCHKCDSLFRIKLKMSSIEHAVDRLKKLTISIFETPQTLLYPKAFLKKPALHSHTQLFTEKVRMPQSKFANIALAYSLPNLFCPQSVPLFSERPISQNYHFLYMLQSKQ